MDPARFNNNFGIAGPAINHALNYTPGLSTFTGLAAKINNLASRIYGKDDQGQDKIGKLNTDKVVLFKVGGYELKKSRATAHLIPVWGNIALAVKDWKKNPKAGVASKEQLLNGDVQQAKPRGVLIKKSLMPKLTPPEESNKKESPQLESSSTKPQISKFTPATSMAPREKIVEKHLDVSDSPVLPPEELFPDDEMPPLEEAFTDLDDAMDELFKATSKLSNFEVPKPKVDTAASDNALDELLNATSKLSNFKVPTGTESVSNASENSALEKAEAKENKPAQNAQSEKIKDNSDQDNIPPPRHTVR